MVEQSGGRIVAQAVAVCGAWLAAACLVLVPGTAKAASGFPCLDEDRDGACQAGVDTDVSGVLEQTGMVSTSGDIVIPSDARGLNFKGDVALYAGGKVTVNADMKAQSIELSGDMVVLGDGVALRATDYLDIYAASGFVAGAKVTLQSSQGAIWLYVANGNASFGEKSKVTADHVDFSVMGGSLTAADGGRWRSDRGFLSIYASGDVVMTNGTLEAWSTSVYTEGHLIDFRGNTIKAMGDGASASLVTAGSTIDLRGAEFKRLGPDAVYISAENILLQ